VPAVTAVNESWTWKVAALRLELSGATRRITILEAGIFNNAARSWMKLFSSNELISPVKMIASTIVGWKTPVVADPVVATPVEACPVVAC
jgi:hypothetical protein